MGKIDWSVEIDPRKGKGWLATLRTENGLVQRNFLKTDLIFGKKTNIVSFSGEIPEGTFMEASEGGSWKNAYRYYYQVKGDTLVKIGNAENARDKLHLLDLMGARQFAPPPSR